MLRHGPAKGGGWPYDAADRHRGGNDGTERTTRDHEPRRQWQGGGDKNGTIFRIIEFAPGLAARNHRTDSIDYIVVISGEIEMELDDTLVRLKAGDVMVQRGTIHNWINRGTAPCVLAVILVDAKSVEAGGRVLEAQG